MFKKKAAAAQTETEETLEEQPVSKSKRVVNTVINVILIIAIIVAAIATYASFVSTSGNGVPSIFGIRIMSIQTESMYPTLNPGDLIFDTAVKDSNELQIGDIITYWTVIDGQRVLNTHRISQIYDGGNYLIFETKGDNNTVSDALTVHESEVVGKYTGTRMKGVGKVFDYLQTSTGFLIVVVVPVAIFFIFHLIQFFRVLFEYQNVKNKLQYEMERGKTEEIVEEEKRKMNDLRSQERARLEAELRDKLRKEILAAGMKDAGGGEADSDAEAEPEPAAETEEEMKARIRAEMEAEAKAKAEAEAEAKRQAEEKAALEAKIRAELEAEARAKAEAEAEAEPAPEAGQEPEAKAVPETAEPEAEPESAPEPEPALEAGTAEDEQAALEAEVRAELEAEAKRQAEEEAKAAAEAEAKRKEAAKAEIRARLLAEMRAKSGENPPEAKE